MHKLPINQKKLDALIKEMRNYNEFPIFLPRYLHSSSKHPISIHLESLVNEIFDLLKICTEEEISELVKSMPQGMTMITGPMPEWGDDEEKRRLAICYVATEAQRYYFNIKSIAKNNIEKSEVLRKFPELAANLDDDGLLIIDNNNFILHTGGIEYKDYILHYHQFLRRGYTSNPNFDFFGCLIKYYEQSGNINKFRIAIDHRRLMSKKSYSQIFECDTWYGAPFDPERIDDPQYIGLTIIKRNKDSLFELTNKLDRTEFYWSYNKGTKSIEIEEISDLEYKFENYNLNKYLHSERDISKKIFSHVDGAVKIYLENNYSYRFNSKMPSEYKAFNKIKLWRIDGSIDLENWIDLVAFFYKGNEMIIEYFNPEEFEKIFELRIRNFKEWEKQQDT